MKLTRQLGFLFMLLFGLLPVEAFVFAQQRKSDDERMGDIRIRAGDAVKLYVYDGMFPADKSKYISNFNDRELIVDGFGEIDLISIGRIYVEGFTAQEISKILEEKFKPFAREPYIIVIPLVRLQLIGGFRKDGMYRFDLRKSFWDMMEEVGGLDGSAKIHDIYIMRKERIVYQDFAEAFYNAQALYELGLQSGDAIVAPRSNRLTFNTLMRYTQFGMSLLIFYFSLINYRER
ncbi:polysaccharide biosynthesis/export family protein [candidate division KSB1 bacterium]|nr:polysaccharide biosynthesis/export family protein [candidate division KSB1 bacterium]